MWYLCERINGRRRLGQRILLLWRRDGYTKDINTYSWPRERKLTFCIFFSLSFFFHLLGCNYGGLSHGHIEGLEELQCQGKIKANLGGRRDCMEELLEGQRRC
jgi:hypothetical protein